MPTAQASSPNGATKNAVDSYRESSATGFTAVNGHSPAGSDRGDSRRGNKAKADQTSTAESSVSPAADDSDWRRQTNGTSHTSTSPTDNRPEDAPMSPIKRKRSTSEHRDFDADNHDDASWSAQKHRRIEPMDPVRSRNGAHGHPPDAYTPNQGDFRPAEAISAYRESIDHSAYRNDQSGSPSSDAHLAAALQKENQAMEHDHQQPPPQQHVSYGEPLQGVITVPAQRTKSGDRPPVVQIEKKRKRIFSNRTKSGCLTCRSRKKKCDEAKPECNNCMRGGFACAGYSQKSSWASKLSYPNKPPVPLQSKEGYPVEPAAAPPTPREQHYREIPPSSRFDGERYQQPMMIEESPGQGVPPSRGNTYHQPPAPPAPESNHHYYSSEQQTPQREYSRPSYAERSDGRDYQTPSHGSSSHPAVTAQLALQHSAVRTPPTRTERDKMLAGEPFLPFCNELLDEREACMAALWRFNNSMNPNSGVSREERERLFRAVIEGPPSPHTAPRVSTGRPLRGVVGKDVRVQAPFNCEYGYNIHIGDEVVIGRNCTILDPCRVTIGRRTIIGPNVNIYGVAVPIDPASRQGSRGPQKGAPVTIGENCWIGGNVTILPRVNIGAGTTIGAGSVVTKDVPKYTVIVGNPGRITRGIYPGMEHDGM